MKHKFLNIGLFASCLCMIHLVAMPAVPRSTAKGKSAIQLGTTVRAKVQPTGLYSQECYDVYYGCMDQFCVTDNASGGSCACSDDNVKFEKQLDVIKKRLEEANRIGTVEVERIQAGAKADIIFTGGRQYDASGNVLASGVLSEAATKEKKRKDLLSLFDTELDDEDEESLFDNSVANKTGAALRTFAEQSCRAQIPESCSKDLALLSQVYTRQIVSDCKGFENDIVAKTKAADDEFAKAESDVRAALKAGLEEANLFDRGQCMVAFRNCMQTEDACGKNWENCVSIIASENMQNIEAKSTAKTKVANVSKFSITDSTMEILDSKRNICEHVLDQCVAVRDMVWPDFLREAAPTIKVAELSMESKLRQSCLTNISDCIQKACKDDIVGKGTATMDSCLSRPMMARSFCKIEIDSCERMEPLIWGYVVDKLAAMRVDACTQEVKDCFTSEDRCGEDFSKCIGMDYEYMHDICPIDKMVVCKKNNPKFSMNDIDSMIMGLYLNIDNSVLDNCQNLVDTKMAEVCGSTTDCNKFAADDIIGTESLRSQKDGDLYRVTGMISFGSIKMGDASGQTTDKGDGKKVTLKPGEIGVQDYLAQVRERNKSVANAEGIITSIEAELNNITGTINRAIETIEQDPKIQFCVSGRDLSQITGKANDKTTARFPNLLNQVKMQISVAALSQAQDNYNEKLKTEIALATKNASADLAQYMCQKIAENGGSGTGNVNASTPLTPPYAISYDVGSGLTAQDLLKGGAGVLKAGGVSVKNGGYKMEGGGMTKETTAVFSRDTRTCHICTTVMTESCKTSGSKSWFHNSRNTSCTNEVTRSDCEDIVM